MIGAVDPLRYDVTAIGIDREGRWHRVEVADLIGRPADHGGGGVAEPGLDVDGPEVDPASAVGGIGSSAVALPLLHGPFGEDGTIQGLFEMLDVAYVGSGVLGSALAMDKAMAKVVCSTAGIPQARHLVVDSDAPIADVSPLVQSELGYPCFVKPANMGSSIGVTKVTSVEALSAAIDTARLHDPIVLVEEAIVGREIEVAVLGGVDPEAFGPGEVIADDEFYSYESKYLSGGSRTVIPADIEPHEAEEARSLALRAFAALRCDGLARCDFFLERGGRGLLLNEVNTMPGFTPISMYPMMLIDGGIDYPVIIDRLVAAAQDRHRRRSRLVHRSVD